LKGNILWDIKGCIPFKVNRRFGEKYRLLLSRRVPAWLILRLSKMETCSSETSGGHEQATRQYVSEDRPVHNNRCENFTFRNMRIDAAAILTLSCNV
jgi:hypothetical protein